MWFSYWQLSLYMHSSCGSGCLSLLAGYDCSWSSWRNVWSVSHNHWCVHCVEHNRLSWSEFLNLEAWSHHPLSQSYKCCQGPGNSWVSRGCKIFDASFLLRPNIASCNVWPEKKCGNKDWRICWALVISENSIRWCARFFCMAHRSFICFYMQWGVGGGQLMHSNDLRFIQLAGWEWQHMGISWTENSLLCAWHTAPVVGLNGPIV